MKKKFLLKLIILYCVFFSLSFREGRGEVSAQVTATASIDTSVLLIGDQTKLTLQVKYPASRQVQFPVLADSINRLEILSRSKIDTLKSAQPPSVTLTQSFVFTCFDSGYFVIPPFKFYHAAEGMSIFDSAETEPLVVTVNTIPVDTTLAIKDIKSPLDVPFSWREAMPYILGGLALAALIAGAIYYWKKRKIPFIEKPKAPLRPAHEIALEDLKLLEKENLLHIGKIKLFHSRLTDITRTYIENRFGLRAMEQTTDEILDGFGGNLIDENLKAQLKRMLELADLVKFAKVEPLPDENQRGLDFAYQFVNETKVVKSVEEVAPETILNEEKK